eukprot:SAG31_NODE_3881_length_3789_cov_2.824390_3_plen_44_part_00
MDDAADSAPESFVAQGKAAKASELELLTAERIYRWADYTGGFR